MLIRVPKALPKALLTLFLLVVVAMVMWNVFYDAVVPKNRYAPENTVYAILPSDYDMDRYPIKYGRILGFHSGTLVFPNLRAAEEYLEEQELDPAKWRIYALVGNYLEDTYPHGDYRYTKVAMWVKTSIPYH